MRRGSSFTPGLVVALALVVGCERPPTLVICHNGNCAGTADPADDDTLEALSASLDLRWRGRPVIDGVEVDALWHRPTQTCLFDHGPGTELPPDTTAQAVALIAEHLALPDVAANGDRFYVFIELKGYVAGRYDLHTADELALHAGCALDLYECLVAAAGGRNALPSIFDHPSPRAPQAGRPAPRVAGRARRKVWPSAAHMMRAGVAGWVGTRHRGAADGAGPGVGPYDAMVSGARRDWRDLAAGFYNFAIRHRTIIAVYGRFPHRNSVLGRHSTAAESRYLAQGDPTFGQAS